MPTPGNELLVKYLKRLQEASTTPSSAEEFNEVLLDCVLENQRGLTPEGLVTAANALELNAQVPTGAEALESTAERPEWQLPQGA